MFRLEEQPLPPCVNLGSQGHIERYIADVRQTDAIQEESSDLLSLGLLADPRAEEINGEI